MMSECSTLFRTAAAVCAGWVNTVLNEQRRDANIAIIVLFYLGQPSASVIKISSNIFVPYKQVSMVRC